MNNEKSRQMMRDGLRGVYVMMQRLDGRAAGEPRSEECANALACIAYSILDEVTGGDPLKMIGLIGTMMSGAAVVEHVFVGELAKTNGKGN